MNWLVVLGVLAGLVLLRLLRANLPVWILGWWIGLYVALRYGFTVPVPASVLQLYMGIATVALFAFVTSSQNRLREFTAPLVRLMVEKKYRVALALVVLAVPLGVAARIYVAGTVAVEAPAFGRTVHPAPPASITVDEADIDLVTGDNPLRHLEEDDPEAFAAHVKNGRDTYYKNCFYCHGDDMAGKGMFAYGLNPIPTNFRDPGTIAMFQETFLFWRVAKGGPGMPDEGGPWDSAMPAWEKFLTEEEMWEVILFLFEHTDQAPRAREEGHH